MSYMVRIAHVSVCFSIRRKKKKAKINVMLAIKLVYCMCDVCVSLDFLFICILKTCNG